jgi:hypothetical protein
MAACAYHWCFLRGLPHSLDTSLLNNITLGGQWLGLLVLTTLLIVFSEVITQGVLALFKRKESQRPLDERDQHIESTATKISYYVLVAGLWCGFSSMFFSDSVLLLFNIIFFFFVLGEILGFLYRIIIYRRTA